MGVFGQFVAALRAVDRSAWIRFFIGIFGLALAFASALLSTASREAGDALATAVFASSALLLAGVVAVTTVPYLARRVVAREVGDVLHYEVTREGLVYLGLTLVVGVAALNTGNNLLFIVVAAMLGAVLVSGVVSALMIDALEVELHLPGHVFAGQSYVAGVHLRNRRWFPVFSISVVPPVEKAPRASWRWQRAVFVYPRQGRSLVRWPDLTLVKQMPAALPPSVLDDGAYFPYLPGGQRQSAEVQLRFPFRGRYQQRGIGLATRFPFSFLLKTRTIALSHEVLVFPSVEPTDEMLAALPMISGELETAQPGRGSDLYRIRNYEPEDSARHVDWKATARSGELKVREYSREDERHVGVVFDNPAPGVLDEAHYERAVRLAASLAWYFHEENSQLSFAAPGLEAGAGIYEFLAYLATVEPGGEGGFLATLGEAAEYRIIVTARPRGGIPTALWASSYVFFAHE